MLPKKREEEGFEPSFSGRWSAKRAANLYRESVLPKPEARGLSRSEAAAYVGVSPSLFDQMVGDRRMPKPKRINARTVWDRVRLDAAFEALDEETPGGGEPNDAWSDVAV